MRFFHVFFGLSLFCTQAFLANEPAFAQADGALARPRIVENGFVASDGATLAVTIWDTPSPRAVIVALHGMGDYANAFAMPGPEWAERGITTVAIDQRGFGRNATRGIWPGAETMRRDFADLVMAAQTRFPGVPVYGLGESMGGAVILSSLAADHPPPVAGIILVAPAVWARTDMPWAYRAMLWALHQIAPSMTLTGKGLKIWPSDNIEMLRAYSRDPLVIKETRVDAVWGLVNLMDDARAAPTHLKDTPPILFLYGAHDQIVPATPTEATVRALGPAADVHVFPDGYHMLMRDTHGAIVRKTVADWVLDRTH